MPIIPFVMIRPCDDRSAFGHCTLSHRRALAFPWEVWGAQISFSFDDHFTVYSDDDDEGRHKFCHKLVE